MNNYSPPFIRREELTTIYNILTNPDDSSVVLAGSSGVGKTTLLKALYDCYLKEVQIFPVYCSCLSSENAVCSLTRIERFIALRVLRAKGLRGGFSTFLLNRIRREIKFTPYDSSQSKKPTADNQELYQVLLLDRNISTDGKVGFRITEDEAKRDFFNTLKDVIGLLGNNRMFLLIIDFDHSIPNDLLNIFLEIKQQFGNKIKVVTTLEIQETEQYQNNSLEDSFNIFPLKNWSINQIEEFLSVVKPDASKSLVFNLYETYQGNPYIITSLLQKTIESRFLKDASNEVTKNLTNINYSLYSSIADPSTKRVVEALAVLYDGGSPSLVSNLTKINSEEVLGVAEREDLITVTIAPDDKTDIHLDLFHPNFKDFVKEQIPNEISVKMCFEAGLYYLFSFDRVGSIIAPSTAITAPQYLLDSSKDLFIDSVVQSLSLALLIGNHETTKQYVDLAIKHIRENDDLKLSYLLNGMSVLSFEEGNIKKAVSYCLESLEIIRQGRKATFVEMTVLSNLAFLMQFQGKLSEALEHALDAMSVSNLLSLDYGFERSLPANYSNVGTIYEKLGDLENALQYYEQAYQLDIKYQNISGAASDLRKMGAVLVDLGRYKKAIENHHKALKLDEQIEDLYGIASDLGNLGVAYFQSGDYEQSLFWLKKANDNFVELNAINEGVQIQQLINQISKASSK